MPVPLPGWEDNPHKKIYVWFDAVIGYLSASIEWAAQRGEPDAWTDWWHNPASHHYYVMGKDNITFHTVMWPAILMGAGDPERPLELPDDIVASEFLHMEGKKLSTSRGQVIYVKDFLDRYDADALRYYLMIAGPENQDTDFTWAEFVRRTNVRPHLYIAVPPLTGSERSFFAFRGGCNAHGLGQVRVESPV